jgi:putative ABC transport system substrate-binding protein
MEFRATAQGEQRVRELVAELVQLPVDIIVAWPGAVLPAKQTTNTLPIVFVGGPDPVALGLVASLTRPGGNVTGLPAAVQGGSLYGKQLELLKEAVPGLARVAVLRDPNSAPPGPAGAPLDAAAQALGLQLYPLEVSGPDDLPIAFETATQAHAEGVFFAEDTPLLFRNRAQLANLARQYRLPSMGSFQQYAAVGGLMVYGPNRAALARRAAYYVDRILKGTPPADLPVEQPREFDFVINLQTAQALGLTIPQHVLLQATEVIQ